jgi:chromosome segregation ATPase
MFLVLGFVVFTQRQTLLDEWKLRSYEPSTEIVRLSNNASFSDYGRRLFYVHDPELLNKEAFAGKCDQTEETIVLGCYITNTKIYVFDVDDERLEGVEEVTAAHEMLHAAYDRLSGAEKERIDALTVGVYAETQDERLQSTIASYAKRDASVVPNELHSILATEIRVLPQELEDYYKQYFLNRLDVVSLAEQYAQEFTRREDQIKQYDEQLQKLDGEINAAQAELLLLEAALDGERALLEGLRSDVPAYNAQVPIYNEKVRDYNARLQQIRDSITQYNELVAARNAIATEERTLLEAIDTRPTAEE